MKKYVDTEGLFYVCIIIAFFSGGYFFILRLNRNSFLNESYSGFVQRKYYSPANRNLPVVVVNDETHWFANPKIYNLIDSGDYLIKNAGTAKHILIKKNDTIIFYPIGLGPKEIKDN